MDRGRSDAELELCDFLLMNAAADLPDLRVYFENFVQKQAEGMEYRTTPVKASMVVKYLNETDKLGEMVPKKVLIGHSSDGYYASMLRMLKKYKFHYHYLDTAKSHQVAGVDIAFSGYPGSLSSSDDFYTIIGNNSKFVVGGIRMQNNNLDLWQSLDVQESVLLAARVMAANRLAHSGYAWAKVMSANPGFGAKQWMVIDVDRIHNRTALVEAEVLVENTVTMTGFASSAVTIIEDLTTKPNTVRNGVVWIVDQLPGMLHAEDVTEDVVYKTGFWTGNGIPFFNVSCTINYHISIQYIFIHYHSLQKTLEASQMDGDDTAKITNQFVGLANVTDLKSIETVFRSRAYRGDLMGDQPTAFGNIDIKLFSETDSASMEFHAKAGPIFYRSTDAKHTSTESSHFDNILVEPHQSVDLIDMDRAAEIELYADRRSARDDIKATALLKRNGPFQWSALGNFKDVDHRGHPDTWNFDAVSPQWAWLHGQNENGVH